MRRRAASPDWHFTAYDVRRHPTGTFSVALYSSNSDTRSVIVTDHVPAGDSTASGTV